jgi:hypothetical protein
MLGNTCMFFTTFYIPIYFQFTRNDSSLMAAVRLLPYLLLDTETVDLARWRRRGKISHEQRTSYSHEDTGHETFYIPIYFQFTRNDSSLMAAVRLLPYLLFTIAFKSRLPSRY